MAGLVVRGIEADVKARLKRRARRHGRSMEEEVRVILRRAAREKDEARGLFGSRLAARFAGLGLDGDFAELRGETARAADFET